jgi:hypothetical protein
MKTKFEPQRMLLIAALSPVVELSSAPPSGRQIAWRVSIERSLCSHGASRYSRRVVKICIVIAITL